jgi:hypothetical protein
MDPLGSNEQYALMQAGRIHIATALEWHQHWDRRQPLATTIETNYIQILAFNLAQTLRLSAPGLKAITINATGRILGPQSFFPIYGPFQTRKWLAVLMSLLVGPLVGQPPNRPSPFPVAAQHLEAPARHQTTSGEKSLLSLSFLHEFPDGSSGHLGYSSWLTFPGPGSASRSLCFAFVF